MRNLILAAAIASAALSGGVAFAAPPPPPGANDMPPPPAGGPMRAMKRADLNGDGVVTRDEAMKLAARKFDRMDTNHDGKLDAAEMAAGPRGGHGNGPRGNRGMRGDDMPPPPPPGNYGQE